MVSKNMFAFHKIAGETLEDKALRACGIIVSSGLGIRNGKICVGGNNVMANNTVYVFDEKDMDVLRASDDILVNDALKIIEERKKGYDVVHLNAMAILATEMIENGFNFLQKPTNFDINAVGAMRHGYKEPEGIALEFAKAFNMLPKSSPNYGLKPKAL